MSAKFLAKTALLVTGAVFAGIELARRLRPRALRRPPAPAGTIYGFSARTIDGLEKPLADYKGQVLLIVNTASLCGFTPQYKALEELQRRYKDSGLRVLGFPCNDFGAQEPGSEDRIKEFCGVNYSVSFDLFSKVRVKGPEAHPLYRFLTADSGFDGEIPWNFTKFLVARDGAVRGRFGPGTAPDSPGFIRKVEALL